MSKKKSQERQFPNVDAFLNFLRFKNPGVSIRQGRPYSPCGFEYVRGFHPFPVDRTQRKVYMNGEEMGALEYAQGCLSGIDVFWPEKYPILKKIIKEYQTIDYEGKLPFEEGSPSACLTFEFGSNRRVDGWKIPFP